MGMPDGPRLGLLVRSREWKVCTMLRNRGWSAGTPYSWHPVEETPDVNCGSTHGEA